MSAAEKQLGQAGGSLTRLCTCVPSTPFLQSSLSICVNGKPCSAGLPGPSLGHGKLVSMHTLSQAVPVLTWEVDASPAL